MQDCSPRVGGGGPEPTSRAVMMGRIWKPPYDKKKGVGLAPLDKRLIDQHCVTVHILLDRSLI